VAFDVEVRLLQELGERLVASPDVALLELVKNASDADAVRCDLAKASKFGRTTLQISDDGAGMSEADFRERWMRIAASSKTQRFTPHYKRPVTGQKGIGRFAIRFLGGAVKLESVAVDPKTGEKRKLEAFFDWRRLDKKLHLRDAKVPYRVSAVPADWHTGTRLTIYRLKSDLEESVDKSLLTRVLEIVSPIRALRAGRFSRLQSNAEHSQRGIDPGFEVTFSGFSSLPEETTDLAESVVKNAWARLTISLEGGRLAYDVRFQGENVSHKIRRHFSNTITSGLYADIVYAPKRKDSFKGVGVDRREVWSWIRRNSGIGVVDNGFRIRPYGFTDDDWLYLNQDAAHNRRDWRSSIAEKEFPISPVEQARPGLNPALNVPTTYQVIGIVNVSSRVGDDANSRDLTPAMDREGFLINQAYLEMVDVVRGGVEFLARVDKTRQLEIAEAQALALRHELRDDLAVTVDAIKEDPRLAKQEKAALVEHYSHLAQRVVEQEEYDRSARQRLEIASSLGVVAGFMTHEAERIFLGLDRVLVQIGAVDNPKLQAAVSEIKAAREQLDAYIRYTRLFIDSLRSDRTDSFSALGQIEWIRDQFGHLGASRGVETVIDCDEDVLVPAMPVALYSAVLLNLYTNALKAVIARTSGSRKNQVLIRAWNDSKSHHLSVQDTGVGVSAAIRERIWDPFFTTTSRVNSPLGTGMGLGLTLVRDLISRIGGRVDLDEPEAGFSTCFHASMPRRSS